MEVNYLETFVCLAINNKAPMWYFIKRRKWQILRRSALSEESDEDTSHMLIQCNYTKVAWKEIIVIEGINIKWEGTNVKIALTY